jgi:hypothetical protein
MKLSIRLSILAAAGIGAFAACADQGITDPSPSQQKAALFGFNPGSNLVECPSNTTVSETALVTPLGGTVSVGGMSIAIPAGALLSDAVVTVTAPASRYLEVDISVSGSEHFLFELPVIVTLSYARCSRSNLGWSMLKAWYIDSETKEMLEPMPSLDNKLLRTVTFTTGHLSGYAIAN